MRRDLAGAIRAARGRLARLDGSQIRDPEPVPVLLGELDATLRRAEWTAEQLRAALAHGAAGRR